LIALHDSELAPNISAPALTTVGLPVEENGPHRAVDLLVDLIHGGAPRRVVIKTTRPVLCCANRLQGPKRQAVGAVRIKPHGEWKKRHGSNFGQDAHASRRCFRRSTTPLADDESVILLGEDIAEAGGRVQVHRRAALAKYGPDRVIDTQFRKWASSARPSAPRFADCARLSK